jgi:hypothetical protein
MNTDDNWENWAQEMVGWMRTQGVRRVSLDWSRDKDGDGRADIVELELSDTIPAPPPAFETLDEEPEKPAGTCIALGCSEPGGWHFDTRYCGPHGRAAAGVKP